MTMTELRSSSSHISLQYALHIAGYTVVQRAGTASGQKFDTAVIPAGKFYNPIICLTYLRTAQTYPKLFR